ncbi:MAG: bifunctional 4-hydroxy-2-oxoglutarate aldolase/2-dehydro-3-deoxy-phosphogluconate aldolase [Bacteroidota bacterium]
MMDIKNALKTVPVIGILRGFSQDQVFKILEIYQECGYFLAEITWNTPNAASIVQSAKAEFKSLQIGAGTVCSLDDYQSAREAGASFIVTPILDEEVVKACVKDGIPVFPGAFSPTEIYRAWNLGATMVKVFPSGTLSHGYIKELSGPFPEIPLVPTGGINIENVELFLKAGAKGLGMGGGLFPGNLIKDERWGELKDHFQAFYHKVKPFF